MNENTVTISVEEYRNLIAAKFCADQFMNLLKVRASGTGGIFSSELETLCLMMGVAVKEEE